MFTCHECLLPSVCLCLRRNGNVCLTPFACTAQQKAVKNGATDGGLHRSIQHISSDPMKVVNEAVEESTDWGKLLLTFVSSLVAPEEEEIEAFHAEEF
ncbi:unnamed protein product [Oncorhynchus mykiss]|uniref:Uncharacterized protein n=1 Tax=Oncorhynchus mykiss TaxID=8022 RepID=A0A060VRI3_ONCMY|nr:unnamed protein product [Oncorhynchus mykiss]